MNELINSTLIIVRLTGKPFLNYPAIQSPTFGIIDFNSIIRNFDIAIKMMERISDQLYEINNRLTYMTQ